MEYNFLELKQKNLNLKKTNKNDILLLLGPPSTKSTFDNDIMDLYRKKNLRINSI